MGNRTSQMGVSDSREIVISGTFGGAHRALYLDSKTKEYTWHVRQLFRDENGTTTAVSVNFSEVNEVDNPDMIVTDRNDEKAWDSFSEPINLASKGSFIHISCPLKDDAPEGPFWWFRNNVGALLGDYIFGFKPKAIKCLIIEPINQPYFRVTVWVLTLDRGNVPIILQRGHDFHMKKSVSTIPAIKF